MIDWVLTRLAGSSLLDCIVVATTELPEDDELASHVSGLGYEVVRGPELDVLERFGRVLDSHQGGREIARVTADCPFVDPEVVDAVITLRRDGGLDFASNRLPPPEPRTYPVGLDVEVCTREALLRARGEATLEHQREHVMPYLYESTGFSTGVLQLEHDLSNIRWTVDTANDLEAANIIAARMSSTDLSWKRILEIARSLENSMPNTADQQKLVTDVDDRWATQAHSRSLE
jgi:spore coat polysaccharide biosynthesis protein SpsF (cytidylyltransferase family)